MSDSNDQNNHPNSPKGYSTDALIEVDQLTFSYDPGKRPALDTISMKIPELKVTAIVGPAGSGKTTLLRCLNRLNDSIPSAAITHGTIKIAGNDIYGPAMEVGQLRQQVGMIFQRPNPLPKNIYDNIAFGLRIAGERNREIIDHAVEENLREVDLWEDLKDRLKDSALRLPDGQQQRLCIARTLAIQPEILLMDEPCSVLDQNAAALVEQLMMKLTENLTIVLVTNNMQQATRISDFAAFLYRGKLVEFGHTSQLFTNPTNKQTEDYISGKFG